MKFENKNGVIIITSEKQQDIQSLTPKCEQIKEILHNHGAILFKDFNINSPDKFKEFAEIFADDLLSDNGEHDPLSTTSGVYTPVSYSSKEKLLWHNENSFNQTWPLIIMFGCIKPADTGGETPIVDSRRVLKAIDPEIIEEFTRKEVMYVRTYNAGFGRTWQEIYQTEDKDELKLKCHRKGIQIKWVEQDQLITIQKRPPIVKHPLSGETSWFTQVQHWHPSCLNPKARELLMKTFASDRLPRNCFFGDGSVISDDKMLHILNSYKDLEISMAWEAGNVMVLDNVLFAHARNAYLGDRRLLVTMGKYCGF